MQIVVPKLNDEKVACTLMASYGMGGGRRDELAARLDAQERRRNGDKAMQIVISKTADGVSMALLSAGLRRGASGFTRTDGFASYGVLEMERKDEHRD